jgi:CRP-like cAMP-binding protein
MNMDIILAAINDQVTLEAAEADYLSSLLIPKTFRQGELLLQSGEPARFLIYVNAGYLMTYYTDKEDTDHVLQFATTGWWSGDWHSLAEDISGYGLFGNRELRRVENQPDDRSQQY